MYKHSSLVSFRVNEEEKVILGAKLLGRLLASPTNIGLSWKGFKGSNTIAYYENL